MKIFLIGLLATIIFSNVLINAQEHENMPVKGDKIELFNKGTISNVWDINDYSGSPYYFNFLNNYENEMVLKMTTNKESMSFEPIETNGKDILVEFMAQGKVVHKYFDNEKSGPSANDLKIEYEPLVLESHIYKADDKGWPIIAALVAACCVKVTYSYTSGNPPVHHVEVRWDCDCLSISLKGASQPKLISVIFNGNKYLIDSIKYTIFPNKPTENLGLIVAQ